MTRSGDGTTLLLATAGIEEAVALAQRCARELRGTSSVELVESDGVEYVAEATGTHPPLAGRALLLLDCSRFEGPDWQLRDGVAGWQEVRGVLLASEPAERSALWSWRRLLPGVLRDAGAAGGLDALCPAHLLADLLRAVRTELLARAPHLQLVSYGAVLDGSIRLELLGAGADHRDVADGVCAAVVGAGGRAAPGGSGLGSAARRTSVPEVADRVHPVHRTLEGVVVRGDGRGRQMGFPTANVETQGPLELPDDGVYAGSVELPDGSRHAAAISVGRRPTYYEDGELLLEAHLLDFDGDLYGQLVRVEIGTLVRGQLRFTSTQDLVAQIRSDVAAVRSSTVTLGSVGDDRPDDQG